MRYFILCLSALVLANCATKNAPDPRIDQTKGEVARERTDFDSYTKYQGPEYALPTSKGFALLRSWKESANARPRHQLYVQVISENRPRGFLSASQSGGEKMPLKKIDNTTFCTATSNTTCPVYEDIGVWISNKMLRQAVKSGSLKLRLNAKRGGDVLVSLPDWYVEGYLQALK